MFEKDGELDAEKIGDMLRCKGYKLTVQRKAVIEVFLENMDRHLSPEEVMNTLEKFILIYV